MPRFEWDDEKRDSNLVKHGIAFQRAVELFDGRPVRETLSTYPFEERWLTTGPLDDRLVTTVWTRRGESIRLISVRRARDGEERDYYEHYPRRS